MGRLTAFQAATYRPGPPTRARALSAAARCARGANPVLADALAGFVAAADWIRAAAAVVIGVAMRPAQPPLALVLFIPAVSAWTASPATWPAAIAASDIVANAQVAGARGPV